MPELPEVETTRRGIESVALGQTLESMQIRQRQFRWPIPDVLPQVILGTRLSSVTRRGKYLLLKFGPGYLIVHLGMSGSIRAVEPHALWRTHDHVQWLFDSQTCLRLHDPRRFGAVLWHPEDAGPVLKHPLLARLGTEPMQPQFTSRTLLEGTRNLRISIKQALLAGHIVVGVGNIYASESLFRARINPEMAAGELSRAQATRLVEAVNQTLSDALESGGSTLRDYVNATGEPGTYFTLHAAVYERDGQPCRRCNTKIERIVQGQRATYFCPRCQRFRRKAPCPD